MFFGACKALRSHHEWICTNESNVTSWRCVQHRGFGGTTAVFSIQKPCGTFKIIALAGVLAVADCAVCQVTDDPLPSKPPEKTGAKLKPEFCCCPCLQGSPELCNGSTPGTNWLWGRVSQGDPPVSDRLPVEQLCHLQNPTWIVWSSDEAADS